MIIHVVNGKGSKDRDLPLSPAPLETLRAAGPAAALMAAPVYCDAISYVAWFALWADNERCL